jgi:hypothetical protein
MSGINGITGGWRPRPATPKERKVIENFRHFTRREAKVTLYCPDGSAGTSAPFLIASSLTSVIFRRKWIKAVFTAARLRWKK